jgi:hypothetical protein
MSLTRSTEAAKKTWRSPIYSFFKTDVTIDRIDGRLVHIFHCTAPHCKNPSGVRRYQDKGDRSSTANLKSHAIRCFGPEAVSVALGKTGDGGPSESIFQAFARQGLKPATYSHRAHTNTEIRYVLSLTCRSDPDAHCSSARIS